MQYAVVVTLVARVRSAASQTHVAASSLTALSA